MICAVLLLVVGDPKCSLVLARFKEPVNWVAPLLEAGVDVEVVNRGSLHDLDALRNGGNALVRVDSENTSLVTWHGRAHNDQGGELTVRTRFANVGRETFVFVQHMLEQIQTRVRHDMTFYCQADPANRYGYSIAKLVDDVRLLCGGFVARKNATTVNRQHVKVAQALKRTGFAYMCGTALRPAMFGVSKALAPVLSAAFAHAFGARNSDFEQLRFCPCSCFVVRSGMIEAAYAREPLTFERLATTLAKGNSPDEIYMLERAWQRLIIGPDTYRRSWDFA